jgi:hypothetical protein
MAFGLGILTQGSFSCGHGAGQMARPNMTSSIIIAQWKADGTPPDMIHRTREMGHRRPTFGRMPSGIREIWGQPASRQKSNIELH